MKKARVTKIMVMVAFILIINGCQRNDTLDTTDTEEKNKTEEVIVSEDVLDDTTETSESISNSDEEVIEEEPVVDIKWQWEYDNPENHNLDSEALDRLYADIAQKDILGSVIIKDGYIVDEYYKDGYDETSIFEVHSSSKSITSTLFGIAVDQGYFDDLDKPISDYFPSVLESDNPYWQDVKIWNLLTHTSGIDSSDSAYWYEWRASNNWIEYVLNRPITFEPGTGFNYSTGNTHLLSAILEDQIEESLYDFGKEYLFDPLDMDSVQLGVDAQGIADGGNGFLMNVYDMAKFGQLYVNDGLWEGERIVSSEWIAEATSSQFQRPSGSADYGYQWWVRTFGAQGYNGYFAQGYAGQFIFVIPDIELIVVFTSNYTGNSGIYWKFVNDVVSIYEDNK